MKEEKRTPEFKNPTARQIWALTNYYGMDFKEIAEKLRLSYDYVRQVASQEGIHRFKDDGEDTSQKTVRSTCPECGHKMRRLEGEFACPLCGLCKPFLNQEARLPFTTTYAHTSNITIGKSLGETLPSNQLWKVLALAPKGREDLPLRAMQLKIMSYHLDPPICRNMLRNASKYLKAMGLDADTPMCHEIADLAGRKVRKAAAFLQISKLTLQPSKVVRAIIYHLLQVTLPDRAEEMRQKFPFNPHYLTLVENFESVVEENLKAKGK